MYEKYPVISNNHKIYNTRKIGLTGTKKYNKN